MTIDVSVSNEPPASKGKSAEKSNPEDTASCLSRWLMLWMNPLISVGAKRPLEQVRIVNVLFRNEHRHLPSSLVVLLIAG